MTHWLACFVLASGAWAADVTATRLAQNPLIKLEMSSSLGDNINGPTVMRVPKWVEHPLGQYYMYFAHHRGTFIRMAYANSVTGPWKIYEPGVLQARDTAFFRPQPDPPQVSSTFPTFYTHVASPEIQVDPQRHRIVMWFHGWWTNGQRWPPIGTEPGSWATEHGYGQYTQVAESFDGLHFRILPPITRQSYLRVFPYGGYFYGIARLGQLLRSKAPLAAFEPGPMPFREGPYDKRVRHVATLLRGGRLYVFFSAIGDAPERILMTTIDLGGDWKDWKASDATEILAPTTGYECAALPNIPSEYGEIEGKARQLRDPAVFEDNGKVYLFYSICGEQGIGAAELTLRIGS